MSDRYWEGYRDGKADVRAENERLRGAIQRYVDAVRQESPPAKVCVARQAALVGLREAVEKRPLPTERAK